jgi:hypothetical protein
MPSTKILSIVARAPVTVAESMLGAVRTPAHARIAARLEDADGQIRGGTSVAVSTVF